MTPSDSQLNLLSQLAYLDPHISSDEISLTNPSVSAMVNHYIDNPHLIPTDRAGMSRQEWIETLTMISRDSELTSCILKDYTNNNSSSGLVAYSFQSPSLGHNIISFRGSETRKDVSTIDWEDNFKLATQCLTNQQKDAMKYVEEMKKNPPGLSDFIVTGHSKGGNNAQCVALLSDDVSRCVTFDSPGFSPEFCAEYSRQIKGKRKRIFSYEGDLDIVSDLLIPVAGKRIFIRKPRQVKFLYNHKPNLFLDKNGNFYEQVDSKSPFNSAIRSFTIRLSFLLPLLPYESIIDTVFDILDQKTTLVNISSSKDIIIGLALLPYFVIGSLNLLLIDFSMAVIEQQLKQAADDLFNKLVRSPFYEIRNEVNKAIVNFFKILNKGFQTVKGRYSRHSEEAIKVNIARLRQHIDRLSAVYNEIGYIDQELKNAHANIDLSLLIRKNQGIYGSKLKDCINYLRFCANTLETTERKLVKLIK